MQEQNFVLIFCDSNNENISLRDEEAVLKLFLFVIKMLKSSVPNLNPVVPKRSKLAIREDLIWP